jgi:hypothetical protein
MSDPLEEFQTYGDVIESLRGRPLPDLVEAAELWPDAVKLVPLVAPAPSENGAAPSLASKFKDLGTELSRGVPEAKWIGHRGLTAQSAATYMSGYIGAGKTPFTLGMIGASLRGEDFCGFKFVGLPAGYRVIYLTQETEATFLPSVAAAGIGEALATGRVQVGYFHDFATDDWFETVKAATAALNGNGLLVVDTTLDWSRASDENDSATMTRALMPLAWAVGTGISTWAIGHTVKTFDDVRDDDVSIGHVRGSGAVVANSSIVLLYKRPKPKQSDSVRYLKMVRSRLAYEDQVDRFITKDVTGMRQADWIETTLKGVDLSRQKILALIDAAGGAELKSTLRDTSGMDGKEFGQVIDGLAGDGKITQTGQGKKGDPVVIHRV